MLRLDVQANDPIVIGRRAAAAVAVAREQIERLIRSFDDVAQAAELTGKVPLEALRLARIVGIENEPIQSLPAQSGKKQRSGPGAGADENRAGRRPSFICAGLDDQRNHTFPDLVAADFRPAVVFAWFDEIYFVAAAALETAGPMFGGVKPSGAGLPG